MGNFQIKIWDISIMPKTWCIFHEKQGKFSERKDSTSIYFQILKYFIEEEGWNEPIIYISFSVLNLRINPADHGTKIFLSCRGNEARNGVADVFSS